MSSQNQPVLGTEVPVIPVEFGKKLRMACFYKNGDPVVGFHVEQTGYNGKTKSVWFSEQEVHMSFNWMERYETIKGYLDRGHELLKAGFGVTKTKDTNWKNVIVKVDIPTVKSTPAAPKTNASVDDFLAALDGFSAE